MYSYDHVKSIYLAIAMVLMLIGGITVVYAQPAPKQTSLLQSQLSAYVKTMDTISQAVTNYIMDTSNTPNDMTDLIAAHDVKNWKGPYFHPAGATMHWDIYRGKLKDNLIPTPENCMPANGESCAVWLFIPDMADELFTSLKTAYDGSTTTHRNQGRLRGGDNGQKHRMFALFLLSKV